LKLQHLLRAVLHLTAVVGSMFLLQVAYKYGVETHNLLKEAGADITFKTYNGMAHSVSSSLCQSFATVAAHPRPLTGTYTVEQIAFES
jgi:hypothetical protein